MSVNTAIYKSSLKRSNNRKPLNMILTCSLLLIIVFNASALADHSHHHTLEPVVVKSTEMSDVSGEEVKSADLAEALTKNVPAVTIVRRSGIANDVILRGQKKDNINILIDNAKIYGACPNRMDPPTSHVLTNTIEEIDIVTGPFDVENFGTLSGSINIRTRKPEEKFEAEAGMNTGSYGYRKMMATVSGGTEKVRILASASKEKSGQYEDGRGNNFSGQIASLNLPEPMGVQYKNQNRNLDAFQKNAFMGKLYLDLTQNDEIRLGYTANRSDDVLYASSPMDAIYDDSNLYTFDYTAWKPAGMPGKLNIQAYFSDVDHPMSNFYRNSSGPGSINEKINALTTEMTGAKIIYNFELNNTSEFKFGIDASLRNWDGTYSGRGSQSKLTGLISIPDVDTENTAVFAELYHSTDYLNVKAAMRYDNTSITPDSNSAVPENNYNGLSGYVSGKYELAEDVKLVGSLGRALRVPDARELYFRGAMMMGGMAMNPLLGTPTLDQTTNTEIDLGLEGSYQSLTVKTKAFYSILDNFIYYNADAKMNRFTNIDAVIYGLELSGSYYFTDDFYFNFGMAYQRGKKDNALTGQSDMDLAEIPPLKGNVSLSYDYLKDSSASLELVAVDSWDDFDSDNGEQEINSYNTLNLKVQQKLTDNFSFTFGIDNLFDRTYSTTNTYQDLVLLSDGTGNILLMNEPGRYTYVNAVVRF